jgi:hypothetical protein
MREYKNGAWEDVNTTHYMLPGAGGADMMVTSKLNGCTFGMGSHSAGGRLVSHLRPPNQNPTTDAQVVSTGTEAGFVKRGDTVRATVNSSGEEQAPSSVSASTGAGSSSCSASRRCRTGATSSAPLSVSANESRADRNGCRAATG